jgi:hypothetical protein
MRHADFAKRSTLVRALVAVLAAGAALLAIAATDTGTATDALSGQANLITNTPCGVVTRRNQATNTLRIVGRHMRDSTGKLIRLYGISLVGGPQTSVYALTEKAASAQIIAAHRSWHSNAIRLQISEDMLFNNPTRGLSYNRQFVASVDRLVCQILALHDIPVLNDTTMFTGDTLNPTPKTLRFWEFIARRYGNVFPVIFDLFNEPRLGYLPKYIPQLAPHHVWRLWRDGGVARHQRYVGMQQLVDGIRNTAHARNVIWVEGPYDASRLALLPQYLLKGTNLVYDFHKEQAEERQLPLSQIGEMWQRGIPLVDGEWSQFAADDRPWECDSRAYTSVPRHLAYLRQRSIGLIAWSLQPGALLAGVPGRDTVHDGNDVRYTTDPARLDAPNALKASYACNTQSRGQGAGALIKRYFERNSERLPDTLFPKYG